ncbi:GNAT family N-acetyltransferase [Microbispora sp. NBC_01389]|uniref:GNAT family N-acetyltransferase n=1 Tax=Microbispora sp. NBC_01389 TaxID=2903584 RepID=UPI00324DFC03
MFTPPYPIITPRLVLRPFTEADLDDLHAFQSLPEVTRYLYWDARTREETKRLEARLVENEFFAGAWSDELVYAMLAREWRASPAASAGHRA